MNKLSVFTDGAARGNPGPGGYGVVISYNQQTEIGVDEKGEKLYKTEIISKEYSAGYKQTTNNRMEMMAAIRALEEIKEPSEISLYSDSHTQIHLLIIAEFFLSRSLTFFSSHSFTIYSTYLFNLNSVSHNVFYH